MLAMVKQSVYRYYSEKLHARSPSSQKYAHNRRVNVGCRITLKTIQGGEIIRSDCARASVCYHFYAEYLGQISGPEVKVVCRVKPDTHHYKAGNINNALYNERLEGEFVIFFDNDMKPLPDFIIRTIPWFYYWHEEKQEYKINKSIAYVQSPQFFKSRTIAPHHDFLGGRNSVFFQVKDNSFIG